MTSPSLSTTIQPTFIPIDVTSRSQRPAFQAQRLICGWKYEDDTVDKIFEQARNEERMLFWVCIPRAAALDVNTTQSSTFVNQTTTASSPSEDQTGPSREELGTPAPNEQLFVSRDGRQLLGLQSVSAGGDIGDDRVALPLLHLDEAAPSSQADRTDPDHVLYVPVGHISLDRKDLEPRPTPLLGNGDGSTIVITTLFILPVYRKLGLATTAMQHAEDLIRCGRVAFSSPREVAADNDDHASKVQLSTSRKVRKCETIGLTTLAERHWILDEPDGNQMWVRMGGHDIAMPRDNVKISYHGPWFSRLGYKRISELPKFDNAFPVAEGERRNLWWAEIWTKVL